MRGWKELRVAKIVVWRHKGLSVADLATLGTLSSVLPALESLTLIEPASPDGAASPDGVQQLAAGLGSCTLPAMSHLLFRNIHVGDAGALALAAALGRGALPRLKWLTLNYAAIGDAGLVALAPALRRLPALETLYLIGNSLGDEGLAALLAPPPPAGVLTKLNALYLSRTQITDAGCATLAESHALSGLETLELDDIPASELARHRALYQSFWVSQRDKLESICPYGQGESESEGESEGESG